MQGHGDAVGRDVDPLDQEPQDARILGWVELVPHRLERAQGFEDIALLELVALSCAVLPACETGRANCTPSETLSFAAISMSRASQVLVIRPPSASFDGSKS
jgi:hypothetical protein